MAENTVPVFPGPGQLEELAKALIGLANHPHDVVWQSRGGYFDVPEGVAARYAKEQGGQLDTAGEETEAVEAPKQAPARSRRRAAAKTAKTAETADEPAAKPRSRASRSKKKGGDS
jgi:hypothetical protein